MRRCWLKGQTGDALHAVPCATGYNLRWPLRAIVRLGLEPIFFILAWLHWTSMCCRIRCLRTGNASARLTFPLRQNPHRRRASSKLNFSGPTKERDQRRALYIGAPIRRKMLRLERLGALLRGFHRGPSRPNGRPGSVAIRLTRLKGTASTAATASA
jgi:hypothetical protein